MIIWGKKTTPEEIANAFKMTETEGPTLVIPYINPSTDSIYWSEDVNPSDHLNMEVANTIPQGRFPYRKGCILIGPNIAGFAMKYKSEPENLVITIKEKIRNVLLDFGYPVADRHTTRNDILILAKDGHWKKCCGVSYPVPGTNGTQYGAVVTFEIDANLFNTLYLRETVKKQGYPNFDNISDIVGGLDESGIIRDREEVTNAVARALDTI